MTKHISCSIFLTVIIAIVMTIMALPVPAHSLPSALTVDVSTSNETALVTITISGQFNVSGMPMQGAHIGIVVDNTNGTHIFADDAITNSTGGYSTLFRLDSTSKGTYQVFASAYSSQAGDLLSTKYFSIGTCLEKWECGAWSACKTNLKQTRTCTDTNQCGTTEIMPPLARSCTPTCQMLAGEICGTNQVCGGSFIDASDTQRCCDTTCRSGSTGSSSSSSGGSTTIKKTTENKTATASSSSSSSSSSGGSSRPRTNNTVADVPKDTPSDITADVKDNKTQESPSSQMALPGARGSSAETLTGRITGALSSNRWLIIDAILIVFICFFGTKLFPGTGSVHKTSPHTSGKSPGIRQYHKTPEFVYNYNPSSNNNRNAINKTPAFTKSRPPVHQNMQAGNMQAAYTVKKIRVNVSGGSRFTRR